MMSRGYRVMEIHMLALRKFCCAKFGIRFSSSEIRLRPHEASHLHLYIGDSGLELLARPYEIKDLQLYHPSLIILP